MTTNKKKELRVAYFKIIIFCTLFYGLLTMLVLSDSEEKQPFIILVLLGYFVSICFLAIQILKTYSIK